MCLFPPNKIYSRQSYSTNYNVITRAKPDCHSQNRPLIVFSISLIEFLLEFIKHREIFSESNFTKLMKTKKFQFSEIVWLQRIRSLQKLHITFPRLVGHFAL